MEPNQKAFSIQTLTFIPGLELNRQYYAKVLAPLLNHFDPDLNFSASLIGYGSDVLGVDNATSMDHNWGPRGQIFLQGADSNRIESLWNYLAENLPAEFMGFPTNFTDKRLDFTQSMVPAGSGPINHLIEIYDIDRYFFDLFHKDVFVIAPIDWLRIPEQKLLEVTAGEVFHDGLNRLNPAREVLRYYPADIRLAKLAAYWNCISNEEAFIGRAVELSDLLGLKLIASRLVNTLLKICFVIKEKYLPYSKWFTHGFDQLDLPQIKQAALDILTENDPKAIEQKLAGLYTQVLSLQNECPGIPQIETEITSYYNRPYRVIMAEKIVNVLRASIKDESIRSLELTHVGLDNKIDGLDLTNGNTLELIFK
jgi:hypothetical protein